MQGAVEGLLHGDQPTQSCMHPVVHVQSRPAQKHVSLTPEEENESADWQQGQKQGEWTAKCLVNCMPALAWQQHGSLKGRLFLVMIAGLVVADSRDGRSRKCCKTALQTFDSHEI